MPHSDNDNGLRFLSVCSGIEAASVAWGPLGWKAVAVSEIEKFPSAVLAHHYPDVPNLGDMTKFKEWPDFQIDMLCGGTPCQAFSVAGLRQGLADPRGNLTLTFLGIAEKYQPQFICWENVPGILSDKTGALGSFLDGLEELGYVVDVDIEDAQFFGLAQRRRRIIVCGQSIKHILNQKTISSSLTIAQCLQEALLSTLDVVATPSTGARPASNSNETKTFSSLRRRMKLFGLQRGEPASTSVESLAAHLGLLGVERGALVSASGRNLDATRSVSSVGTKSHASNAVTARSQGASEFTGISWPQILDAPLQTMSECITSTSSSETIDSRIYSCARLSLFIAERIHQSMDSSPVFWSAAQSSLTALKGFTNYARQTSSDLFGDMEWVRAWRDFIEQAEPTIKSLGNLRVESFGEVLPISAGMSRDTPSRREKREGVTAYAASSIGSCRDSEVSSPATREGSSQDYETTTMVAHAIQAGALRENPNSGPDGIGVQAEIGYTLEARAEVQAVCVTPIIAFDPRQTDVLIHGDKTGPLDTGFPGPAICFTAKDYGADAAEDIAPTLRAGTHDRSHANGGVSPAVTVKVLSDIHPNLCARPGGPGSQDWQTHAAVYHASAVRRLSPMECERLQGFPDGYTDIPWRGKPNSPDGPRYKALGNSWAVPKFAWLGARIQRFMPSAAANDSTPAKAAA